MNVASVPVENSTSETTDTSLPGNRPWLLLTAAVDARNGVGCLFSRSEREKQYIHSFRHFLRFFGKNQDLCKGIVFCENSGADLAPFKLLVPFELTDRVEFLSLSPDPFRPEMGKSWNEMLTIDTALEQTQKIGTDELFVKVTGRYPVLNLRTVFRNVCKTPDAVHMQFFPMMPMQGVSRNGRPPLADTRCIAIRRSVWKTDFEGKYETTIVNKIHFEHVAFQVWKEHREDNRFGFMKEAPLILGKQGSTMRIRGLAVPKTLEPLFLLARRMVHVSAFRKWEKQGCPV